MDSVGVTRIRDMRLSGISGCKRLLVGDNGFERAATQSVIVDKTMLIADLLDSGTKATLFCRPRRFGKTSNMSMLKAFLEIPSESDPDAHDLSPLFKGLKIWDADGGRCREHRRAYPVVFFSFNAVKRSTWGEARAAIELLIASEYERHGYLRGSDVLTSNEIDYYERISGRGGMKRI